MDESSGRWDVGSETIASPLSAMNQQGRDIDFQLLSFRHGRHDSLQDASHDRGR
jgi:hypothetical protein